ncbi:hypothetical protein [Aridibaculum aurantiacum]|uniref:hypothetical protein n=1 Tax=Aridibaculum aurantiacum TaxID=2810307 RepID=UPI001A97609B|nr:hypothetical protein [Aridibaculum aurantiacum]
MKKLLIAGACLTVFACTNPENNVDDPADTAGLNYSSGDRLNTNPGPTADDTMRGAGIDTSNAPKDSARAIPPRDH